MTIYDRFQNRWELTSEMTLFEREEGGCESHHILICTVIYDRCGRADYEWSVKNFAVSEDLGQ